MCAFRYYARKDILEGSSIIRTDVSKNIALLEQKFKTISELDRQLLDHPVKNETGSETLNSEILVAKENFTSYYG